MFECVFWLSIFLLAYIYMGYPLLIKLSSQLGLGQGQVKRSEPTEWPNVTILIAAFNEAEVIEATVRNKLTLDYPKEKLRVLVVSDESEDGTDGIVRSINDERVTLLRQIPRAGKTSGLNLAMAYLEENNLLTEDEIICFSDANSIYADDALKKIVGNFSDSKVGYVTGKMVYTNEDGSVVGDGCSAYMKYENFLREQESSVGSVVGVDGGIDAMRARLHKKLNADQLPDFVQPLKVVEQGSRVVYDERAILKEQSLDETGREFKMRVRVSLRALWALHDMRQLFNPAKFGLFSWQLISHKLLRYLAGLPMITALVSNLVLLDNHFFYALLFISQIVFYGLAWGGYKKSLAGQETPWYMTLPYYLTLLNTAALYAAVKYLKGEKMVLWKPRLG